MATEVTERWEDQQLTRAPQTQEWRASRTFDVVNGDGTLTDKGASQAPGVPQIDEQHPRSSFLRVKTLDVRVVSTNRFYRVTAQYAFGAFGGESENPLEQKPKYRWRQGSVTVPIDLDADGNPIVNSAGDAFDPPVTREFPTLFLTYTRNEPYYDPNFAQRFSTYVNKYGLNVRGVGYVGPGQMMCRSIMPASEYTEDADFVSTEYEFEFRLYGALNADGLFDPFKTRLLDQGVRAFYDGGGAVPGKIYEPDATPTVSGPVSSPVRLDGYGGTYDDGYLITEKLKNPQSSGKSPKGATLERTETAYFLKYSVQPSADFSGMQL